MNIKTEYSPRIINTPKETFNIGFVIPSYNEGYGILDTLYSIVVEAVRNDIRIAIFVTINNSNSRTNKIYNNNKKTATLIIGLIRRNLSHIPKSYQSKVQKIIDAGVHITLVDMYSEKYAPEICNVGIARDYGSKSLLTYLERDDSLICHTDADCKIKNGFFRDIFFVFPRQINQQLHPDKKFEEKLTARLNTLYNQEVIKTKSGLNNYVVGTGPREFILPKSKREKEASYIHKALTEIEFLIETLFLSKLAKLPLYQGPKKEEKKRFESSYFTPGSYIVIKKHFFEEIGGFPHIAGAEDVFIGTEAYKKGYKVRKLPGVISTQLRISDRTEIGHGLGQDIKRASSLFYETVQTYPLRYFQDSITIENALKFIHFHDKPFEAFGRMVENTRLYSYEIREIFSFYEKQLGGNIKKGCSYINQQAPQIFSFVRNLLREKYKNIDFKELASDINYMFEKETSIYGIKIKNPLELNFENIQIQIDIMTAIEYENKIVIEMDKNALSLSDEDIYIYCLELEKYIKKRIRLLNRNLPKTEKLAKLRLIQKKETRLKIKIENLIIEPEEPSQ